MFNSLIDQSYGLIISGNNTGDDYYKINSPLEKIFSQKNTSNHQAKMLKYQARTIYNQTTIFNQTDNRRIKNINKIFEEFQKEKRRLDDITFDKPILTEYIISIVNKILDEKSRLGLELTRDKTIFFTILKNKCEVHLELFVDHTGEEKEVLYSVYEDDEIIFTGWSTLFEAIAQIKKITTDKEEYLFNVISQASSSETGL